MSKDYYIKGEYTIDKTWKVRFLLYIMHQNKSKRI